MPGGARAGGLLLAGLTLARAAQVPLECLNDATQECDASNLMQMKSYRDDNLSPGRHQGYKPLPISGKSVYFILVDRFARSDGNDTECGYTDGFQDNNWCNGTIQGIIDKLDYIEGMGFECIWITPIVEQFVGRDGQSGYASHGYWAKNLYEVDPHFGSIADVQELARQLHARDMCFILDIVANHMGPIHSSAEVATFFPFNETKHYHQRDLGDLTFDEYVIKSSGWPPPAQAMGPGTMCAPDSRPDCGCYQPVCGGPFDPPCTPEKMSFNATSGCPPDFIDSMCRAGDYTCRGYNETYVHEGWFYDLGDLNQTDPFVREQQLKWVKWLTETYMLDGIRLDTAPFMAFDFLSELQEAAGSVPILGETTATNMTFHAEFQASPPPNGRPVLGGVLNFPLTWTADAAFCGFWFPHAVLNLSTLIARTSEQLYGGFYKDLDLLGNFVDNHDMDRIAKMCLKSETSRIYNSLAWSFLTKGMPMYYYGTEVLMTEQRGSLWQTGFQEDTEGYLFVKRLNMIRKRDRLATQPMRLLTLNNSPTSVMGLERTETGTMAFFNNVAQKDAAKPVQYCLWAFPDAGDGHIWMEMIAGVEVHIEGNCYHAPDSMPKVLSKVKQSEAVTMEQGLKFF